MSNPAPPIHQALDLAAQALLLAGPGPRVGCIIAAPDGSVLGQGVPQHAGGAHAEIMALRDAFESGRDVRGATAYVTLEPCSHHDRTAPCCCNALIEAGVARVVMSVLDPLAAGRGAERLRTAGVEVEVGPGFEASRELNLGFFSRVIRGMPWVRLKAASSLDGTTALHNGASQWITSRAARADGHAWRARACAVLTGIGTVLGDNPRLDVREVATPRQPDVVVVDSQLQLPLDSNLLLPVRTCYIYTAIQDSAKEAALQARGAVVVHLPNPRGKVDLAAMLRDLGRRGINELHVEAGHKLNGSLIREGLVDELLVYLAPRLLGTGSGLADFGPLNALAEGLQLEFKSVEKVGVDLRIVARVEGRDRF